MSYVFMDTDTFVIDTIGIYVLVNERQVLYQMNPWNIAENLGNNKTNMKEAVNLC